MVRSILIVIMALLPALVSAQEIGANFNHDPEIIDMAVLRRTPVEWIRTTPYIFEYINGEKDPATAPGLQKVIDAAKAGYKVAFGFRWDFKKYQLRIPEPGTAAEQKYFATAAAILKRVGPYVNVFKLGNEPNLETMEADLQLNEAGVSPLVRFTERLLDEVVEPYYKQHPELTRPDVYTGSLPALFEEKQQQKPGVQGLIRLAQENDRIKGLSVHLHISDSADMDKAFRFVRTIMPDKPIIVPEFSLFRLYNKHLSDELGSTPAGAQFAAAYHYPPGMKLYEWYSKANTEKVSAAEWAALFASRAWFPPHFMQTYYRYFQKYGVVLATYGYLSQSAPAKVKPNTPVWFINPIFPMKSLQRQADGGYTPNPLWFDDFVAITRRGKETAAAKPNIIILYADDLGYGDLGCYGAKAVKTPNIDRLAANGMQFTDAHCTAATCTPSRASLLTGVYAFRNNAAILPGDAPLLIRPGTLTLPDILRQAGYSTAVVGKWHLGLGNGVINWNGHIAPGPNEIGFDYSFIIPATTDRVPTVFVENGKVPNLDADDPIAVSYSGKIGAEPTGLSDPQLLKQRADTQHSNTIINGISRIGYMTGGKRARWVDEDIPLVLNDKARRFIVEHHRQPFFLYYPFPNIHVPRAPNKRFAGTTKLGARGDVIAEMDWMVGQITQLLDSLGIAKNTLIIFSSDNGPVLDDGYEDHAEKLNGDHQPSGIYRGGKYSAFEAGTRVSTITCWPGVIQPGVADALCSQVDLLASLAALTGRQVPPGAAQDSRNALDVWLGRSKQGREYLLEESYTLSFRKGNWKYIAPQQKPAPDWLQNKQIETGLTTVPQLYDLQRDPAEAHNLAKQHPEIVNTLKQALEKLIL
jgi:Arylsulfatase A and related enzymes